MLPLTERLRQGDVIILDGATGTELQRRRFPTPLPLWSAAPLLTHPGAVRQIHLDYLAAGADILTANTFRTHGRTLAQAGIADRAQTLTYRAVTLAVQARRDAGLTRSVLVAGSMGPLEDSQHPERVPSMEECAAEHRTMATNLAAAGVDLLLVETMNVTHEAVAASQAAKQTGLPFIVSFVCTRDGNLLGGEPLANAVRAIEPLQPAAIMVNCVLTATVLPLLDLLRTQTRLPIGAYANIGHTSDSWGWQFTEDISPQAYARHVRGWLSVGAQIVGGCCGTTPAHIALLADVAYDVTHGNHRAAGAVAAA
jgi:S-methylmethionine-dependent homocysteine/selenocysteine methylase